MPRLPIVAALLALTSAAPAWAHRRDLVSEGIRSAVEVRAMDLEMVAPSKGRLVTDLRRDELVVKVDGKVLPLDYFVRIESGQVPASGLAAAPPDVVQESSSAQGGGR